MLSNRHPNFLKKGDDQGVNTVLYIGSNRHIAHTDDMGIFKDFSFYQHFKIGTDFPSKYGSSSWAVM
mgnify:CR=1 FL=1